MRQGSQEGLGLLWQGTVQVTLPALGRGVGSGELPQRLSGGDPCGTRTWMWWQIEAKMAGFLERPPFGN